jgi:phosphoserine phosphatase
VGNSLNDTEMLDQVEFAFMMEPDKQTKRVANEKSWNVVNRNNIAEKILLRIN